MEQAVRVERLRVLLGLEIHRISDDLLRRRSLLVDLWGRHRVRSPFLDTTFQRYRDLPIVELLQLERPEIEAVEAFYRELDELRFYLSHTEDMPRALSVVLDGALVRITDTARVALSAIGARIEEEAAAAPPWTLVAAGLDDAYEASGLAFGGEE